MDTRELLVQYAPLLNAFGSESEQGKQFLEAHRSQREFYDLAVLSKKLMPVLMGLNYEPGCDE